MLIERMMKMKPRKGFFPNGFDLDMAPFQELVHRLDQFFNESFQYVNSRFNLKSFSVKTYETDSDIIVQAELPGYSREHIKIEAIGHQLRILAEQQATYDIQDDKAKQYQHTDTKQILERVITLPFEIPKKDVKASLKHGILKIVIPKKNHHPTMIDIQ